jgi:hypothetical protein
VRVIFIKFTPRFFLSRLTSSWPDCVFIALFFGPIPVALDWDNTSSFPFFGFMSSDCSLGSLCGCVRVCLFQFLFFGFISSICAALFLFVSLVHTQYYLPLPDVLRCPLPLFLPHQRPHKYSPARPKYIYITSFFVTTLSLLDSLRVLYCYC